MGKHTRESHRRMLSNWGTRKRDYLANLYDEEDLTEPEEDDREDDEQPQQ